MTKSHPAFFPTKPPTPSTRWRCWTGKSPSTRRTRAAPGALWRYLLALNFALFGRSIFSLRAFAAAVGVVSVGMAYLVVRELNLSPAAWRAPRPGSPDRPARTDLLWREAVAVAAALLLGVSYWHVNLSRMGFSAVLMLLIQDATIFCLWRALATGRRLWFWVFGLGAGVLVYNYLPGKVVPAMLLLFLLLQWLIAPAGLAGGQTSPAPAGCRRVGAAPGAAADSVRSVQPAHCC